PDISQDMRYAGPDNFTGRKVAGYNAGECILRREGAEALREVQAELGRQSLGLKVYDCYPPARATSAVFRWMETETGPHAHQRYYPRIDRRSLRSLGYISGNSMHSRGTAVDLTIVKVPAPHQDDFDPTAEYRPCTAEVSHRSPDNSIDMGTSFDCFDVMSHS